MKITLRNAAMTLALAAGCAFSAQAGTVTCQGVSFTTSVTGNLLTLEIDAANRTGDWALSSNGLNANGCAGGVHVGSSLCYSGERIALGDDMVFQFSFKGGTPALDAPHLKVNFFGEGERKVGSLLSQAIAPVPEPQTYALMPGGLGVMGFMARRRQKKDAA